MRILFVAMSNSIHTARYINQVADQGWDLHLFPSTGVGTTSPYLKNITVYHTLYSRRGISDPSVKIKGIPLISERLALVAPYLLDRFLPGYRRWRLAKLMRLIKKLKPDIIHSMEFQAGGYLTLEAKKRFKGKFPAWIATNWGSDIYLFGRLEKHREKIKAVLTSCDYYSCECQRDVGLAREFGFKGEVLPVLPNTGGFNLSHVARLRQPGPTSARRLILIKGYQHWAGRALVALQAIELCAQELKGYTVKIYLASTGVKLKALSVSRKTGIPIEMIPYCSHDEMLSWYGRARVYIGLSISDAIPTSLLEAMVMGAFPIQSNTGAAEEWIAGGETGFIVPSEDPEIVAESIRKAVKDNKLVDNAAELNYEVAKERLDEDLIRPQVVAMYQKILAEARGGSS